MKKKNPIPHGVFGTYAKAYLIRRIRSNKTDSVLLTRTSEHHARDRAIKLSNETGQQHVVEKVPVFVDVAVARQMLEDYKLAEAEKVTANPEVVADITYAVTFLACILHCHEANHLQRVVSKRFKELDEHCIPGLTNLLVSTIGLTNAKQLLNSSVQLMIESIKHE